MDWPSDPSTWAVSLALGLILFLVIRVLWLAGSLLDQKLREGRRR